jgi:hypothetical protein
MGRTIPSFRIASEMEIRKWRPFRAALGKNDRKMFDEVLSIPRFYKVAQRQAKLDKISIAPIDVK